MEMGHAPHADTFQSFLKFFNTSQKKRSIRVKPDLALSDVSTLRDLKMTKRVLIGVTNSFGDFLGIASPYTIRLKLNMKKLFEEEVNKLVSNLRKIFETARNI